MFIIPVMAMMTLDDTWDRFVKKYTDPGKVIVGKTVSMKEYAKMIILASLDGTLCTRSIQMESRLTPKEIAQKQSQEAMNGFILSSKCVTPVEFLYVLLHLHVIMVLKQDLMRQEVGIMVNNTTPSNLNVKDK